jgi:hypothetical protein
VERLDVGAVEDTVTPWTLGVRLDALAMVIE